MVSLPIIAVCEERMVDLKAAAIAACLGAAVAACFPLHLEIERAAVPLKYWYAQWLAGVPVFLGFLLAIWLLAGLLLAPWLPWLAGGACGFASTYGVWRRRFRTWQLERLNTARSKRAARYARPPLYIPVYRKRKAKATKRR